MNKVSLFARDTRTSWKHNGLRASLKNRKVLRKAIHDLCCCQWLTRFCMQRSMDRSPSLYCESHVHGSAYPLIYFHISRNDDIILLILLHGDTVGLMF